MRLLALLRRLSVVPPGRRAFSLSSQIIRARAGLRAPHRRDGAVARGGRELLAGAGGGGEASAAVGLADLAERRRRLGGPAVLSQDLQQQFLWLIFARTARRFREECKTGTFR
jgi:hypothetical protein